MYVHFINYAFNSGKFIVLGWKLAVSLQKGLLKIIGHRKQNLRFLLEEL